ncbi:hypothetical protein OIE67_33555 [Nonomuraea fuscirosea]|uniref:hypothetical protein n=1 Tax=Nonomuraea fuscirosea TaxID=1291556 RepID=UPI002DDA0B93|nr:hypothetical protein [Nonomuraea fuscirosea]WSA48994.1 hypothetical protein OIE67_33555 [Nonomuraea fuscirosea]
MLTKHQLLRDAAEKESLAAAFTRYARGLAEAFDGIPVEPGDCEPYWTGPAAQRFLTRARSLRRELGELEDSCLATAENLRDRAGRLREEAAQFGPSSENDSWGW